MYQRSETTPIRPRQALNTYQRPVSMCCLTVKFYLWPTALLAVKTLTCAVDLVEQKQVLGGQISGDAGRANDGRRRLRDLVLAGVNTNSLPRPSYDVDDDNRRRSVAESLERLLHAGYRYSRSKISFSKISKYRKYLDIVDIHIYWIFSIFSKYCLCITSNKLFNHVYPDNSVFINYYKSSVPNNTKLTFFYNLLSSMISIIASS